jgi:hypothetical protein
MLFKKLPKAGISAKKILPTFVSTKQKTNTYDKQKKANSYGTKYATNTLSLRTLFLTNTHFKKTKNKHFKQTLTHTFLKNTNENTHKF